MTYPKSPAGLNWQEHYTMANALFYACVEACALVPRSATHATPDPEPEPATKRKHRKVETT